MKYLLLLILCFTLFFACSHDSIVDVETQNSSYDDHPKAAQLQDFLHSQVTKGYPGAIMLVQDADGLWIGADGYADIENKIRMGTENISCVGSITKTYTATAIMMLVESGALELDDRIADILPHSLIAHINNADQATVRQLLNHTSGIFNYTNANMYGFYPLNRPEHIMSVDECLDLARGHQAYNSPGTDYEYSNTGYLLLGEILEKVTGQKTETFFKENIFEPLNLENTYYSSTTLPKDRVKGYTDLYGNGKIIDVTFCNPVHYGTDSGLISDVKDLATFLQSLAKGEIVSPETFDEMTTWIDAEGDNEFNRKKYGLGLMQWETPYGTAIGHQGAEWGYFADAFYFPEQDVTYVLLVNGAQGTIGDVSKEVVKAVPYALFN